MVDALVFEVVGMVVSFRKNFESLQQRNIS
jgi:hypothetical protein